MVSSLFREPVSENEGLERVQWLKALALPWNLSSVHRHPRAVLTTVIPLLGAVMPSGLCGHFTPVSLLSHDANVHDYKYMNSSIYM